ncbi:MAG: hypothetical protein NTY61_01225 [Candidatus Parcubacteria bacterium]|nr:hypothetical protein [Candidatus Parcubacteria bacterium]
MAVGPDGLIYARSAYCEDGGHIQGDKGHQGIEVLKYDSSTKELSFVKTYFLGTGDKPIGQQFFIKPSSSN